MGGAPFLNSSWDENDFHVEELFEKETYDAFSDILNHNIGRCPHPKNKSEDIICLKNMDRFNISQKLIDDIAYHFKEITNNQTLIQLTAEKNNDFINKQVREQL